MTWLLALYNASFHHDSQSHIKSFFHEFVKQSTIQTVKSKLYACTNLLDVTNGLGVLQDDQMKNDHPLTVPLLVSYIFKLH